MEINKSDLIWNYGASLLKVASSAILIPLILRLMSAETVGIWAIFMTIISFSGLLEFGFTASFTRSVSYVYSGVTNLKIMGVENVSPKGQGVNFGLLKGVIEAMRWFYFRQALILFLLLTTIGTWYVHSILQNYKGDTQEVYAAWAILCIVNTYNLYTLYYESLLLGQGMVKRSKQIVVIGHTLYLITAALLILAGYGLVAIISAQAVSVIIIRWLSYRAFFTDEIRIKMINSGYHSKAEVIKVLYPNAVKIGLTSLGGFFVSKSSIIIGSMFLSLKDIGTYGITMQLVSIIGVFAGIHNSTYQPKIAELRVVRNTLAIKEHYIKGQFVMLITYIFGGVGLIFMGVFILDFIGSQTQLFSSKLIILALVFSLLECNHQIAGGILLTNNYVPFFKASLFAGGLNILLLIFMFNFLNMGIVSMILAPGIAQLYNNIKWPYEVIKQLDISIDDFWNNLLNLKKEY
jgi:O-antigen/teichoic acid export membrane protein